MLDLERERQDWAQTRARAVDPLSLESAYRRGVSVGIALAALDVAHLHPRAARMLGEFSDCAFMSRGEKADGAGFPMFLFNRIAMIRAERTSR